MTQKLPLFRCMEGFCFRYEFIKFYKLLSPQNDEAVSVENSVIIKFNYFNQTVHGHRPLVFLTKNWYDSRMG